MFIQYTFSEDGTRNPEALFFIKIEPFHKCAFYLERIGGKWDAVDFDEAVDWIKNNKSRIIRIDK